MSRKATVLITCAVCALTLGAIVYFAFPGLFASRAQAPAQDLGDGFFHMAALDTGDSDAILILSPDGQVMLVDTGLADSYAGLHAALTDRGIKKLDALVLTHPHADHIGGAARLLEDFYVERIYTVQTDYTSDLLTQLDTAAAKTRTPVQLVQAGDSIALGEVTAEVLAPLRLDYDELNDCSIVLRMTCGAHTFLLMGDAEKHAEQDLAAQYGAALKCDVLKVGHHGDDDATKKSFLALTQPAYALITADRTVDPDHANPKALERLAKAGAQVFVTDEHGEIEVTSDGAELKVTVQRGA